MVCDGVGFAEEAVSCQNQPMVSDLFSNRFWDMGKARFPVADRNGGIEGG